MSEQNETLPGFDELGLSAPVLKGLAEIGYETPSPIQAQIIPLVAAGHDVIGQAQTGTGKTAAFALPLLSKIDIDRTKKPQYLVLAPTRELAIQVAEAFQKYGRKLPNFHVLPIYGGQDIGGQLRQLKRGVHVIVGTPGRVMDHMRRGTLDLSELSCVVLDEADEMLRMGFIDDVEWILEQTPRERQVALFSATMPAPIRRIAQRHLKDPKEVTIQSKVRSADTVRQRFWMVSGLHKLDALTRILESEPFEAMLIFARTKTATTDLAERLQARGFAATALNGDVAQAKRERVINQLKAGKLDIVVATDVAARGLDVDRITHVINFDIPYDTESYIHRIGRTGRAGRTGDAILFVSPRERRMLQTIERATRQPIERMDMPSTEAINNRRVDKFKQRITDALAEEGLEFYQDLIERYRQEHDIPSLEIAAALAKLLQGEEPLLLDEKPQRPERPARDRDSSDDRPARPRRERQSDTEFGRTEYQTPDRFEPRPPREKLAPHERPLEEGMERFRIEVGYSQGAKPGHIVGAIANEAGLDSQYIGRIELYDDYSTVDLPEGMPREVLQLLKKTWVAGHELRISRMDSSAAQNVARKDQAFRSERERPAGAPPKRKFAPNRKFSKKRPRS